VGVEFISEAVRDRSNLLTNLVKIRLPKTFSALYLQPGTENVFGSLISTRLYYSVDMLPAYLILI
jgi:hypothetical protein